MVITEEDNCFTVSTCKEKVLTYLITKRENIPSNYLMTPYLPRNHIELLFLERMGNISQKANVSFNMEESKRTKLQL